MIERIFDSNVVNAVSNHPSIFPHISGGREGPLDCSEFVEDKNNVFLAGEHGLAIFHWRNPGCYEMHYRVLPSGRGKWSLGFALGCLTWMFSHPDVLALGCRVPRGNYASRALVRRCCGKFEYTLPKGWIDEDGWPIDADVYSMTRERWERLNANA